MGSTANVQIGLPTLGGRQTPLHLAPKLSSSLPPSTHQHPRMMRNMIRHEALNEPVAVIIPLVPPQDQFLA